MDAASLMPINEQYEMDFSTNGTTTSSNGFSHGMAMGFHSINTTGSSSAYTSNESCFEIDESLLDTSNDEIFRALATNPELMSPQFWDSVPSPVDRPQSEETSEVSEMLGRMWAPDQPSHPSMASLQALQNPNQVTLDMETLNHLIANNPQADISALILQAAGGNSQSQPSQQQSFANQPSHSSQHQQLMQHHSLPMSMGHSDIRNLDHLHGDDTSKSRSAPLPGKKVTRPPLPPQVQNLGHNPPPPPAALRMNGSSVAGHGVRSDPTGASKVSGRPWSLGQGHNFQTGVTGTQTGGGNHQQGYDSPTQTSQDPSHMVELQLTPQQAEMLFMGQGGLRLQPGDVSSRIAQRKERNREIARNSRLRKKAYVTSLEDRIRHMESLQDTATQQIKRLVSENEMLRQETMRLQYHMANLLQIPSGHGNGSSNGEQMDDSGEGQASTDLSSPRDADGRSLKGSSSGLFKQVVKRVKK